MAVTERTVPQQGAPRMLGAVMLASLSLPGVLPRAVHSEEAPERAAFTVKWLNYKDQQPGLERIEVSSPSLYLMLPIHRQWSLETSAVFDAVSGASPRYHSAISGATTAVGMEDHRTAADAKMTRYFDRSAIGVGVAYSKENDYESRSASVEVRVSTENNNTTFNVGFGVSDDSIGSTIDASLDETRQTREITIGVTQALSKHDLAQVSLTYNQGSGFYSDPYKLPDVRPEERDQSIALVRWNHFLEGANAVVRSSYRFYDDTFGIRAHTVEVQWVQSLTPTWTVTPLLRYYTQRAASFYYDPVYDATLGEPFPPGYLTNPPRYISADQRLSAFGAVTAGLKLDWMIGQQWGVDLKFEQYKQRSDWRVGGDGSPGIAEFNARFFQVGLQRRF